MWHQRLVTDARRMLIGLVSRIVVPAREGPDHRKIERDGHLLVTGGQNRLSRQRNRTLPAG